MTEKAIQLTVTWILGQLPNPHKELLRTDLKSRPEKVRNWISQNMSGWALKTALENPIDSATRTNKQGLHEVIEVYSPDFGEDGRLLFEQFKKELCSQ